jgi:hypothetical protein
MKTPAVGGTRQAPGSQAHLIEEELCKGLEETCPGRKAGAIGLVGIWIIRERVKNDVTSVFLFRQRAFAPDNVQIYSPWPFIYATTIQW